jgi:uncharacterized protein (DUF58 family)
VIKERARETRPHVTLVLDDILPSHVNKDTWNTGFEKRIRELASVAVAHLKNGCDVKLTTTAGRVSAASVGTGPDPLLRFLALIAPIAESATPKANRHREVPGLAQPRTIDPTPQESRPAPALGQHHVITSAMAILKSERTSEA